MLCDDHWKSHCDLSVQLHSLYAEAEYCNGRFQEVGYLAGLVIQEAESFQSKLSVYATLMRALGAQNKLEDAIGIGIDILTQLGVQNLLPLPDRHVIIGDFTQIANFFRDVTDEKLLNQKLINDSNIIAAMKILQLITLYAYLAKQEYLHVIITQMLRLTIQYGLCKETCAALAYCSSLLVATEDFKGAERIGNLAITLLQKFNAKEYLPQVHVATYPGALAYVKQLKLTLDPLLHGYQIGMQLGDIQYAMTNACRYVISSFLAGRNLEELAREMKVFGEQMIEYNQLSIHDMMLPITQAVSSLMSLTYDSSLLDRQATEQKELLEQRLREKRMLAANDTFIFGGIVSYMFNKYETAAEMVENRKEMEKSMSRTSILYGSTDFYDGLIFLAMARASDDPKWRIGASKAISKLTEFVNNGNPNCENKLLLLQAEFESIWGETKDALLKYELSIIAADEHEFIHEHAIANERLADSLLKNGDSRASNLYGKAHKLYLQWGATCKCSHLCASIPF